MYSQISKKISGFDFFSNERSEYSYIGLGDFFFQEKSKIWSHSILIFRGLIFDLFISSLHFFKRKANSTIQQQKCKGHEKRDRLLI